jgi:hypothetical protein
MTKIDHQLDIKIPGLDKQLIAGQWTDPSPAEYPVISPSTEQVIANTSAVTIEDADKKLMGFELAAKLMDKQSSGQVVSTTQKEDLVDNLLDAFEEVNSATESGVRFEDYSRAVSGLNSSVKKFYRNLERKDITIDRKQKNAIDDLLRDYENVKDLWGSKFSGVSTEVGGAYVLSYKGMELKRFLLARYPGISSGSFFWVDNGISHIWSIASVKFQKLDEVLYSTD